ncbi:MAG: hypothetical protein HY587_04065 [Candidatus Omnitrophica bacterium]|nr:hypothetical protein [Candidatus Omnitrophota bacterium]
MLSSVLNSERAAVPFVQKLSESKQHILLNKNRGEYGDNTVEKLSERLGVDPSVLGRLKLFAEKYPILAMWPKLTWSHFRILIPVEDDKTRLELTEMTA